MFLIPGHEIEKSPGLPRDGPSPEVMLQSPFSSLDRVVTLGFMVTQAEGLSLVSLSLRVQVGHLSLDSRARHSEVGVGYWMVITFSFQTLFLQ